MNKIEENFNNNVGLNNKRVWPTEKDHMRRMMRTQPVELHDGPTHTETIHEMSKNVKTLMGE